jgi:hypothetical protein
VQNEAQITNTNRNIKSETPKSETPKDKTTRQQEKDANLRDG